jgi:hypothetical protein
LAGILPFRKTSWDTNSSTESSKEAAQQRRSGINQESDALNEYSKLLNGGGGTAHIDILNGLNGFAMLDKASTSGDGHRNEGNQVSGHPNGKYSF